MLNYKDAGVNIEKADLLTEMIKSSVKSDNIGNFAGLYEHEFFPDYYLAACTDGVGTKVIPLIEKNMIDTIAIDLIAMNVNDLICTGARPLFFLDYFATNKLDVEVTSRFITALKNELAKYKCILLGGETAELGGLIADGHFDVGGFAVGIVNKKNIIGSNKVNEGDIVIGLSSSGPHSNGYSLIRKLYSENYINDSDLLEALKPTYIYVNEVLQLCDEGVIKSSANITGGGIEGNLCRAIPDALCAVVDRNSIPESALFTKLESCVGTKEAYKTFNMGVGMCLIAEKSNLDRILTVCDKYKPFIFGEVVKNEDSCGVRFR